MALTEATTQYIHTLAQTFGLDEKALVAKAEADENARRTLDIVPRATFSSELDKVRDKTKQDMQGEFTNWKTEYYQKEVLPKWNENDQRRIKAEQDAMTLRAKEAAYRAVYGDLEGFDPAKATPPAANPTTVATPANNPQWMTREEAAQLSGTLTKEMSWVTETHRDEFGKRLDLDAFEKHVIEGRYQGPRALRQAYEDFVKPAREAKQATEWETKLAEAKKAGAQEYAASHSMPLDNGAPAPRGSAMFRQPSKEDANEAILADPNAPQFVKDDAMRKSFLNDLGNTQLTSKIFAGG